MALTTKNWNTYETVIKRCLKFELRGRKNVPMAVQIPSDKRFQETGAAETVALSQDSAALSGGNPVIERAPPEDRLVEAARQKGAALLLSGACYRDGDTLRLQARLTDAATGESVYTFNVETADMSAANGGIDELAERVVAAVAAHLDLWIDISVMRPPATYQVFLLFQRGLELVCRQRFLGLFEGELRLSVALLRLQIVLHHFDEQLVRREVEQPPEGVFPVPRRRAAAAAQAPAL